MKDEASTLRFDLFGREVAVLQQGAQWVVLYVGADGKRRLATDIAIPPTVHASELATYLADLCHERATEQHPEVRRIP